MGVLDKFSESSNRLCNINTANDRVVISDWMNAKCFCSFAPSLQNLLIRSSHSRHIYLLYYYFHSRKCDAHKKDRKTAIFRSLQYCFEGYPQKSTMLNRLTPQIIIKIKCFLDDDTSSFYSWIILACHAVEVHDEGQNKNQSFLPELFSELFDTHREFLAEEVLELTENAGRPMEDIETGDEHDNEGVAWAAFADTMEAEQDKPVPKEKLKAIYKQAHEGLTRWKEYFSGNDMVEEDDGNGDPNLRDKKVTWESIGPSDSRRLRFNPAEFADAIPTAVSRSALDPLQFTAEDLGLGLSWHIEGTNGEFASALLGPNGSLWVLQDGIDINPPLVPV